MFPAFAVIPIMDSGNQVFDLLFNFFFSLPLYFALLVLVPAVCIRIISRS